MHVNVIGGIFLGECAWHDADEGGVKGGEAFLPGPGGVRQIRFKRRPDAIQSQEQMHVNVIGGIFLGECAWHDADEGE